MRITRVYCEAVLAIDSVCYLTASAAHYIKTVLRSRVGDSLILFNGDGYEYLGKIIELQKNQITLQILQQESPQRESPLRIHLAQGLAKGERMDFVIQKAVELGVTAITPLFCSYSQVKWTEAQRLQNRLAHWREIACTAAQQSGRLQLPMIHGPQTYADWLQGAHLFDTKIICHPRGPDNSCKQLTRELLGNHVALLIGPEGGFAAEEVQQAQQAGFMTCALGPRILRTETAPVVALTLLQYLAGDLV